MLAKSHNSTKLMIIKNHKRCKHLGVQATKNKIRLSGFWIPKARQAVKSVISKCTICQKFNNLVFKYPKVTNLPKSRVNYIKPYRHTGIDYTGHVWVKGDRGVCKMYLLIFMCLIVGAVHVELVKDMSTNSFILALIRFTDIYDISSHIYSGSAKSFIAGCKLRGGCASSEFDEHFQVYSNKHFIPHGWVVHGNE